MKKYAPTVVFCDDIRREFNGKLILIGTYASELIPVALPTTVGIAFWIRVPGLAFGKHRVRIRIANPSGDAGASVDGEVDVLRAGADAILSFGPIPLSLNKAGDIIVEMSVGSKPLTEIGRLPVAEAQAMPS